MIVPMLKVLVVGPKPLMTDVVGTIQRMGRVHLAAAKGGQGGVNASQLTPDEAGHKQLLEKAAAEMDGLLSLLGFRGAPARIAAAADWNAIEHRLREQQEQARALIRQRLELEEELALIASYQQAFEALSPLMSRLENSSKIKAFGFIIKGGDTSVVEPVRLELKKLTGGRCEIYSHQLGDGRVATLVAYHINDADRVRGYFAKIGVNELRLPSTVADLPMAEAIRQLKQKLVDLPGQISKAQAGLRALADQWGPELAGLRQQAADILARFNVRAQIDESRFTFLLHGFLPQDDLPRLKDTLRSKYQDKVTVQALEIGHHDVTKVPVILKNNSVVKPFELLLSLMNPPLYGTVDPTPFVAIFFPLYFGFIIGDIGFGAVLMLFALSLLWRKAEHPVVKGFAKLFGFTATDIGSANIGKIFFLCSLWTIGFGYIYGELFGDFGEHMHWLRPLSERLNRMNKESLFVLLGMSLVFGVVQIFTGYIIGIINGVRHNDKHHILEPIAFMIGLIGVPILSMALLHYMKVLDLGTFVNTPPLAVLAIGLVLTLSSCGILASLIGIVGPIELAGAVGNVLSYARLFAIGLSAVYLAYAANVIAKVIGMSGNPIAVVTGVVVAVVLIHPLFFIVGMISPIAQPGRLQLVEFFTKFKFYDTNGKKYKPFKTIFQQEDHP